MGNLPAKNGIPYLDVTTTKNVDGDKLYISVINRHDSSDITSSVTIANGGTISSTGTAWAIESDSYSDRNIWTNPTDVVGTSSTITGLGSSFSHTFPAHSYTILEIDITADAVSTPTLIGQVTDSAGSPIAGATVTVVGTGDTTTDANGYYQITTTTGTKTVTASASGYTSGALNNVEVIGTGSTSLPFQLDTS